MQPDITVLPQSLFLDTYNAQFCWNRQHLSYIFTLTVVDGVVDGVVVDYHTQAFLIYHASPDWGMRTFYQTQIQYQTI